MAITIAHNVAQCPRGPTTTHLVHLELFNYMSAQPRFTIVDSKNIGLSGGWFVFELTNGTGWQCWLGVRNTASDWDLENSEVVFADHNIFFAFSPKGGWDVGSDSPGATMFSLCPSEGGGPQGQFWLRIRMLTTSSLNWEGVGVGYLTQHTIWDDPDEGFFCILTDLQGENKWDSKPLSLGVFPMDSRFGGLDSAPYVVLCSQAPKIDTSTSGWLSTGTLHSSNTSAMLLPGDNGSPPVVCYPSAEPLRVFDNTTQPDPVSGEYDLDPIGIYTKTPNRGHARGLIKRDYMRQGLAVDTARRTYGDGRWVVPVNNAKILLPWDKTIL